MLHSPANVAPVTLETIEMQINQPCYERDFLTLVVLRVDFPALPVEAGATETPFTDVVKARFPHVSSTPVREMMVNVTESGAELQHTDRGFQWTYRRTVDGTLNVGLGPGFLAIEYGPADYKGSKDLQQEFSQLLSGLQATLGVKEFSRIGLRYVNEIRLPGRASDWEGIIAPDLVSSVYTKPIPGGRMQRSMRQHCEIHGDNQLILNYGLPNPDYPAVLMQRHFVIDIDCSRSGAVSMAEALDCISELNTLAGLVFEASIGESLRDQMGVKK